MSEFVVDEAVQRISLLIAKGAVAIEKGGVVVTDADRRLVEGWGSVQIVDKDGHLIMAEDIEKAMPRFLDRGGDLFYGHMSRGGIKCGRVLGFRPDVWKASDYPDIAAEYGLPPTFEVPGVKIIAKVFQGNRTDDVVWERVVKGELGMMSFGGKSWTT